MKKKVKSKAKTTKRSTGKSAPEQSEMPDLVAVMLKVAERLEALERKMEVVISQTAGRHSEMRQAPQNVQHQQPHQQGQNQNQPSQHNRGREGKPLFKAVCADCRKHCEIPFKPSGERPVYCKECFGKRKAGGQAHKAQSEPNFNRAQVQHVQQRQIRGIPNGGGKVTISEMVPRKNSRPPKKIKK